jgi:hypothetical protein
VDQANRETASRDKDDATRAYIGQQTRILDDQVRGARANWTPRPHFDELEISEQESPILRIITAPPYRLPP